MTVKTSIPKGGVSSPVSIARIPIMANAIGSNMFEGFEPTPELIQLYVDWKKNIISERDFDKIK